ncbi:hypothetical protein V8E36_004555 [Tilletia maclaganii]
MSSQGFKSFKEALEGARGADASAFGRTLGLPQVSTGLAPERRQDGPSFADALQPQAVVQQVGRPSRRRAERAARRHSPPIPALQAPLLPNPLLNFSAAPFSQPHIAGPLRSPPSEEQERDSFGDFGGAGFEPQIGDFDGFVDFGGASPSPEPEDDPVREYLDLLFKYRTAVCVRLDGRCWVVEGMKDGLPEVGLFYHLVAQEGVEELTMSCDCRSGRQNGPCLHKEAIAAGFSAFRELQIISSQSNPMAIEVASALHGRHSWLSVVASQSTGGAQLARHDHKRTIVSLVGPDQWCCSSFGCTERASPPSLCVHRQRAKAYLEIVLGRDVNDVEENSEHELKALQQNEVYIRAHQQQLSCSSAARRLPRLCQLPEELALEPDPVSYSDLPEILPFDGLGRCGCGAPYDPSSAVTLRSCTVFHSKGAIVKEIEVQQCSCRRRGETRTIGPDLANLQLFNWSVDLVFTHDLLHSYTSQLAASPTPLSAFHTTIQDAYAEHRCKIPFVSKSTFIKVYFAFLKLQDASVAFVCSACGPTPSTVIADGVVLSHSSKLSHELLRPSTAAVGQINTRALPGKVLQIIPTSRQRDALRDVAHCLVVSDSTRRSLALSSLRQLVGAPAPSLHPHRSRLLRSLQEFVDKICRAEFLRNIDLTSALRFVLRELAAEEGVWQLCRPVTVQWLRQLASETTTFPSNTFDRLSTSLARQSPCLGHLARLLHDYGQASASFFLPVVTAFRSLLEAIADLVVLQHVWFGVKEGDVVSTEIGLQSDSDSLASVPYTQSGSLYGAAQCRERPVYVKFGEKSGSVGFNDTAQLGDTPGPCKKYFADYVSQRQTGGIMALWCRHLICVGFHIIPRCEGRNDVFSAIFTRWPTPPTTIIYDFACQLAPYCLTREPTFFKDCYRSAAAEARLTCEDQLGERGDRVP